jgi:hypothetical protein
MLVDAQSTSPIICSSFLDEPGIQVSTGAGCAFTSKPHTNTAQIRENWEIEVTARIGLF